MDEVKRTSEMTRRTAMAGLGTAALASAAGMARAPRNGPRKPNFLFIMADDLGYADLSCYGRTDYQTPVLDAFAAQGTRFTHAYANSAVCTATRVALITGRYQYRLPIGLEEPLGIRDVGLPPSHPTIASLLRGAGYATSLIGKWHLGSLPKFGPLQSGYEEFWGLRGGGVDYFTHRFNGNPDLWDGDSRIEENGYLTELLADRTMRTLDARKSDGRPFLISLHFTAPHWPWEGPDDRAESARLDAAKGPGALFHYDGGDLATYAEMVTFMDRQIGRIFARLGELGLEQDTVVVFTSDNGGERFSNVWPFSGRKTELLEGGLRVPAIVRWPGVSRPGMASDQQIMSMDWLPTFLAAAGGAADPRYPSDGIDIRAAVGGKPLPARSLFWRYKNHGQEAARIGRWKYLKMAGNSFLFDVVADPLERANLKDRQPQLFAELVGAWQAWNRNMLPLDPESASGGFSGETLADHYGIDD
jgi:arylsulfatase A-like enzyme